MQKIMYFSPTGNTAILAHRLSERMQSAKPIPIEHNFTESFAKSDIILMYPIHGFNPPRTIKRFIKKLPKGSNNIFLIAVGCNKSWANEAVHNSVSKVLHKKGYQIIREDILAMPLTLVMDFKREMKTEIITQAFEEIDLLASKILEQVSHNNRFICVKAKMLSTIGKLESPAARLFGLELHANKNCTNCGFCIKECPEQNIKMHKKPRFGFKCSMCLRCIYQCPEQAISPYLSKFIPIKGGYDIQAFIEKEDSLH